MTREEFIELQSGHQKSGLSLKLYLQQRGTCYSTYNCWRKKYCGQDEPPHCPAPVSFHQPSAPSPSFLGDVPCGVRFLFPNGIRSHFGGGTEDVLRDFRTKSL